MKDDLSQSITQQSIIFVIKKDEDKQNIKNYRKKEQKSKTIQKQERKVSFNQQTQQPLTSKSKSALSIFSLNSKQNLTPHSSISKTIFNVISDKSMSQTTNITNNLILTNLKNNAFNEVNDYNTNKLNREEDEIKEKIEKYALNDLINNENSNDKEFNNNQNINYSKRELWTLSEDKILLNLLKKYMFCKLNKNKINQIKFKIKDHENSNELLKNLDPNTADWNTLSIEMNKLIEWRKRCGKQLKERYINHLDPNVVKDYWTNKEEKILIEKQKEFGNRWSEISKFLPGRTDNAVKNYFYSKLRRVIRCLVKGLIKNGTYKKENINEKVYDLCFVYKIVKDSKIAFSKINKERIIEIIKAHRDCDNGDKWKELFIEKNKFEKRGRKKKEIVERKFINKPNRKNFSKKPKLSINIESINDFHSKKIKKINLFNTNILNLQEINLLIDSFIKNKEKENQLTPRLVLSKLSSSNENATQTNKIKKEIEYNLDKNQKEFNLIISKKVFETKKDEFLNKKRLFITQKDNDTINSNKNQIYFNNNNIPYNNTANFGFTGNIPIFLNITNKNYYFNKEVIEESKKNESNLLNLNKSLNLNIKSNIPKILNLATNSNQNSDERHYKNLTFDKEDNSNESKKNNFFVYNNNMHESIAFQNTILNNFNQTNTPKSLNNSNMNFMPNMNISSPNNFNSKEINFNYFQPLISPLNQYKIFPSSNKFDMNFKSIDFNKNNNKPSLNSQNSKCNYSLIDYSLVPQINNMNTFGSMSNSLNGGYYNYKDPSIQNKQEINLEEKTKGSSINFNQNQLNRVVTLPASKASTLTNLGFTCKINKNNNYISTNKNGSHFESFTQSLNFKKSDSSNSIMETTSKATNIIIDEDNAKPYNFNKIKDNNEKLLSHSKNSSHDDIFLKEISINKNEKIKAPKQRFSLSINIDEINNTYNEDSSIFYKQINHEEEK